MATLTWNEAYPMWQRPEAARSVSAAPEGEAELLRRAATGQRAAVEELVERYQDVLYSIAMTFTRDPYQAEDLTQEAWIRILRALPSFRGESRFSTWIYRLTMNLFLNRRSTRSQADPENLAEEGRSDPQLDQVESNLSLTQAVRALPVEFRAVVALRYIADLSYQEIANALDIPLGTVQSRLKRGLERLGPVLTREDLSRGAQ